MNISTKKIVKTSATLFSVFLLGLIFIPANAPAQSEPLAGLDSYIENAISNWHIPGLAIAIVKDNRTVYAKGFGVRDMRQKDKVDANTMFAIASNTKAFTATALGMLVSEGKIDWDDPVLDYLPEFQMYDPEVTRKITIRDLLCHRSGLGTWAGDLVWFGSNYNREETMYRIRFVEPVSEFRTAYHYCNLMFLVAGQIIPQVTGISWDEFISQRFFEPLGMTRSVTSVSLLANVENVATPHTQPEDELIPMEYVNVDNSGPAGAINSCVNDVAKWIKLQLGNGYFGGKQLVDSAIIIETRKTHIPIPLSSRDRKLNPSTHFSSYGLGWRLSDYQGRLLVNHTGGLDGMFSFVGFLPEENLGVVLLTNSDNHTLMRALPYHVFDEYLNLDFQDWSERYLQVYTENQQQAKERRQKRIEARMTGTRPSHDLKTYAGSYNSRVYGDAKIEEKDGKLFLRFSAHPNITGKLNHWQLDTFQANWDNPVWNKSFVYFDLNDLGEIRDFRVSIRPDWVDTREYTFVKSKKQID